MLSTINRIVKPATSPKTPPADQPPALPQEVKALAIVLREEFGAPFRFYDAATGSPTVVPGQEDAATMAATGSADGGDRDGRGGAAQGDAAAGGRLPHRVPAGRLRALQPGRDGRDARPGQDAGRVVAGAGAAGEVGPIGPRSARRGPRRTRPAAQPGRARPPVDDRLGGDDGAGAAAPRRQAAQGPGPRAPGASSAPPAS